VCFLSHVTMSETEITKFELLIKFQSLAQLFRAWLHPFFVLVSFWGSMWGVHGCRGWYDSRQLATQMWPMALPGVCAGCL